MRISPTTGYRSRRSSSARIGRFGRAGAWFELALAGLTLTAANLPAPRGPRLLEPMDYRNVVLLDSPLKRQVEQVRRFYLEIPDDDLLKGFRLRAGLPAPGHDLGGWYSGDVFHVFGQIVSGLARMYAGTGDVACRNKAERLVREWARTIAPDGYFYAAPPPNAPHYIFDKTVWGLLDDYLYCGDASALQPLSRITDWAIGHLERSRKINDTSTEWYTLSENLYRAYLATGQTKYRDFARVWEYRAYWDCYATGTSIFSLRPEGYHAYSHVNTLGGTGAGYLVTGDPYYLRVLRNAYDFLRTQELFATGGYGPDEGLFPPEVLRARLSTTHNTFETQCGSWAAFKLAKYLIAFTGDAGYGDWIERLVINGIGASLPMTTDGHVFYYSDYCLHGGSKRNTDFGWSCCTGTRPQAVADFHDLIYFTNADTLYVNLFTPSQVRWQRAAGVVALTQATRFPDEFEVTITLRLPPAASGREEFGVALRVPGWLAGPMQARLNGEATGLPVDAHQWATLRRRWQDQDCLVVTLPRRLWWQSLPGSDSGPAALLEGPTVLAFRAPEVKELRTLDRVGLEREATPVPGQPMRYRWPDHPSLAAQPFFTLDAGERYYLYLDPAMRDVLLPSDLWFQGRWHEAGSFRYSNDLGASVVCEFTGTGIAWLGYRYNDAGRAEVTIDGQVVEVVDQYGPGRDLPFDWRRQGLTSGRHTLRVRLMPDKTPASTDHYINIAGFEVIPK